MQQDSTPDPLAPFLERQGVLILDGGVATELETRGADLSGELWSARLLLDDHELLRRVHLDFLEAGADVVTSVSYQATLEGFERAGLHTAEAEALLASAVEIARTARDAFWAAPENRRGRLRPLVVASVGPHGAALADGSEYTGEYDLDDAGLVHFHRRRLEILAGAGADLLAFETVPSAPEARVLARLLEELDAPPPAWLSFQCRDGGHLADGSPLAEIAAELEAEPRLAALGVNCIAPELAPALIEALRSASSKPIAVYPNSGEGWDSGARTWVPRGRSLDWAAEASRWHTAGARLLGGCCRTRPADIHALRAAVLGSSANPGYDRRVGEFDSPGDEEI